MELESEVKGHFRNEYHKGLINLIYTVNLLSYEFFQSLKNHGVTEQQYNVLRILRGFRSQAPVSLGFIKERMLDRNSDVSRIIDKLQRRGLVSRDVSSCDRRQKAIQITDKGLNLLSSMLDCEKKVDLLLNNLTPDELRQLNQLLDKIRG